MNRSCDVRPVRGGNTVVPDLDLQVVVSWQRGITVDACALLLTADGKVRNDEPTHASESLRQLQQLVTFAFADDLIEQHEVDGFEAEVRRLGVTGPAVDAMRSLPLRRVKSRGDPGSADATSLQRVTP